ncbi:MAG: hypothetical protein AABZ33_07935 [Chloroflexota bacterium]
MGTGRDIKVGVSDGQLFSQAWKIAPTARRAELVLSGSRTGHFMHLTMHGDPGHWHTKVGRRGEEVERPWVPPVERVAGVRRLVQLLLPLEAVRYPRPRGFNQVRWCDPPSDQAWLEFTILHCRLGIPRIRSAEVMGGTHLVDGTDVVVIARLRPAEDGSFSIAIKDPGALKARVEAGSVGALLSGTNDVDGCLWFLHLYNTPRDRAGGVYI